MPASPRQLYHRLRVPLHAFVLLVVCLALYAANFDREFQLDSTYGLVENPWVRSLEHIGRYFVDPTTLTLQRSNADYRPVLQVTFALNHAISGYEMWSWHLVQIMLHFVCALGIYGLCGRVLQDLFDVPGGLRGSHLPLLAALLFAVHPAACGVVNYLWARSSLLVAALLLPSFLLFMKRPGSGLRAITAVALYALALFAKVEAVAALAVYFLWEVALLARRRAAAGDTRRAFTLDVAGALNLTTLRRLWPYLAVTAGYFAIHAAVVPDFIAEARKDPGITAWIYLNTQVTAWWHYVLRWFAPVALVADDFRYPWFHSPREPEVMLALAGWAAVAFAVARVYRHRPGYAFLVVSALALISPTSSFLPISEMVNEHRPYLPVAVLSLAWLIPAYGFATRPDLGLVPRALAWLVTALAVGAFTLLTAQRNAVFHTEAAYWLDVVRKAPSARSYLNYGRVVQQQGDLAGAEQLFRRSLELAPNYHFTHLNLALLHERRGEIDAAAAAFDRAVACDTYTNLGLVRRGQFHLRQGRFEAARGDLLRALPLAKYAPEIHAGLAIAAGALGRADECLDHALRLRAADPDAFDERILAIVDSMWNASRFAAGLTFSEALAERFPDAVWAHHNVAVFAERLGRADVAARARRRHRELTGQR